MLNNLISDKSKINVILLTRVKQFVLEISEPLDIKKDYLVIHKKDVKKIYVIT